MNGICVNCGKACEETFCNKKCMDEAIQYDANQKQFGKAVADAWWQEQRERESKSSD